MALKRKPRSEDTSRLLKVKRTRLAPRSKARAQTASSDEAMTPEPELCIALNHLLLSEFSERYLSAEDPLLKPSTSKNYHNVSVTLHYSDGLSEDEFQACFNLIAKYASSQYQASSWGWNPMKKKAEMRDPAMRFLLVRPSSSSAPLSATASSSSPSNLATAAPLLSDPDKVLGFLSFMATHDDPPYQSRPVLYIYEVFMSEALRGAGVGSHLIHIAETVAMRVGISKTMLTVFTVNKDAQRLYKRLGYARDQCTPEGREIRGRKIERDYIIMGKRLEQATDGSELAKAGQ